MKPAEVRQFILEHPGLTCTQLSKKLGVNCESLASTLKKLCDGGLLYRRAGGKPRGGFMYWVEKPRSRAKDKTSWQRILDDSD